MDGQDSVAQPTLPFILPAELLLAVFDNCDCDDVIQAARVSRAWRALASSHALYYASISIRAAALRTTSSVKDAITRFARRITVATTQGVLLAVNVTLPASYSYLVQDSDFDAVSLDASILDAIMRALPHALSLSLSVPAGLYNTINDRSRVHPARMLEHLEFFIATDPYTGITPLNNDIFAGTCPKLRFVQLFEVPLLDFGYPAFESVTDIALGSSPVYRFSTIAQIFPRAQCISLSVQGFYGGPMAYPPEHVSVIASRLAHLYIFTNYAILPRDIMDVLSASPPIADVTLDWSRSASIAPQYISISEYLQNMNGPLDLSVFSLDNGDYTTDIVLRDANSGVTRTFREPQLLESDSESNRRDMRGQDIVTYNFTAARFQPGLAKIVSLHIEPLFWNEIDYLTRRLPALQLVEPLVHGCPKKASVINVDRWMNQDDQFSVSPMARAESCRVVELKLTAKRGLLALKIHALTILRLIRHCHLLGPGVRARVTLENVCRIPCEYDDFLGSVAC